MSKLFIRGNFDMHLRRQLRHRCRHKICSIKKLDLDISRACWCMNPALPFPRVYTLARYDLRALVQMQRSFGPYLYFIEVRQNSNTRYKNFARMFVFRFC